MEMYSSEYNKRKNQFDQGITMIKNKNNYFFLNVRARNSIYDLADIKSYFTLEISNTKSDLRFRANSGLPEKIENDIRKLFDQVWISPKD